VVQRREGRGRIEAISRVQGIIWVVLVGGIKRVVGGGIAHTHNM